MNDSRPTTNPLAGSEAAPRVPNGPLQMAPEDFERLGRRLLSLVAPHATGRADGPVHPSPPASQIRAIMDQTLPEHGTEVDAIVDFIEENILPYPLGNNHPRFFSRVIGAGAPVGAIADMVATGLNIGVAGAAKAAIGLEHCVNRWLMELIGFPTEGSMGLLTSGGSLANLTGIAVARHWAARNDGWNMRAEGLQGGRPAFTLYASAEAHLCISKSVELLGIGSANLRSVPTDRAYAMDTAALEAAVAADRAAGHRPFCVVASAGTVNTGAIDPFDRIADLCAAEDLWFHIDGAYGALGVLDPAAAPRFAGMARADSLALDPHKWLSVPIECGCALVRDRGLQHETFNYVAPYLQMERIAGGDELPLPFEYGVELSRGFRGLKAWATLMHLGRAGLREKISRNNAVAHHLLRAIESAPDLELVAPAPLSIVCFRFAPPGWPGDAAALDALNKAINDRINADGDLFFTPTILEGRYALRVCIIHYGTSEADVEHLAARVRSLGKELMAQFV